MRRLQANLLDMGDPAEPPATAAAQGWGPRPSFKRSPRENRDKKFNTLAGAFEGGGFADFGAGASAGAAGGDGFGDFVGRRQCGRDPV